MKKILIILFLFYTLSTGYSLSEVTNNTSLYNVALGGPHTGLVQGFDSFYNNPGLLAYYDDEISFFKLNVNLKGDALDVLNLYLGGDLSPDDPAALLTTLQDKGLTNLLVGLDINGPLSIGVIGNNWGWYLKNSTNVYLDLPGITSTADIVLREDLVFSAGIAVPFKMRFGDSFFLELVPGVMSRTTLRAELRIEEDLLGFMGYMSDFSSLLADFPLNISPMFALDAGFVINVYDIVSLSGVVKDIYTPILKYPVSSLSDALGIFTSGNDTTGNLVYREINFGLSSDIPLGVLSYFISDLDVYIDYYDLLKFEKNTLLHLGFGVDLELLEKFHLLSGVNQGLLSLGLNVDLGALNIGFAMYGTEEGSQPGANSVFNFLLSIGISF